MRLLSFLLFLVFLFFAIFARWYFVCDILNLCVEEVEIIVEQERDKTLQLIENDTVLLDGYDQFVFDLRSYEAVINKNNQSFLDTLALLMLVDSTKRLTITGFYSEQEMDVMPGFNENMGQARANYIRTLLMERGIEETYIDFDHGISLDSLISEPLTFQFYTAGIPTEYAKIVYTFTNMTFSDANFEVNSAAFNPGVPFRLYADSLKIYLRLNSDKQLTIIGHTDSDASKKHNYRLGLNRAKSAKGYFEDLGVESQIDVNSLGETKPIAPNDNVVNKQKNRRVNFVIE